MNIHFALRRFAGWLTSPYTWLLNYAECNRCHRGWWLCRSIHHTRFDGPNYGSGVSALCEACWRELSAQQRLPYYRALYERWLEDSEVPEEKWLAIEQAVREGR